jgi:hypothetical protein
MAGKRKPASSPDAKPFADKAKDLNALRDSVVDAASVGAGLWLSYLFLLFYLFVAAAAITHKDLLFENPVKLLLARAASVPSVAHLRASAFQIAGQQGRRVQQGT